MTRLLHDPREFRAAADEARLHGRLGLVPTMGALHEGHLALVAEARRRGARQVALTLFVNPMQFGPGEDFTRYPRTLDADLDRCRAAGVDLVFAPDRASMYPKGFQSEVRVSDVTRRLEGAHRPGHFVGVTTVVAKLFGLAGPCVACFGRKDYQQYRTIVRMVEDLDMPVEVVGLATVREPDGLALSSRNRYLDAGERARAVGIARGLRAAHAAFAGGERAPSRLERLVRAEVEATFDAVDYVDVSCPDTLDPFESSAGDRALVAVAARLGSTRLIDNTVLGEDGAP